MEEIQPTPVADEPSRLAFGAASRTSPAPSERSATRQARGHPRLPGLQFGFRHPGRLVARAADGRWLVDLRCPECEWTGGGTYAQSGRRPLRRDARQRHRGDPRRPDPAQPGEHGGARRDASSRRCTPTASSPKTSRQLLWRSGWVAAGMPRPARLPASRSARRRRRRPGRGARAGRRRAGRRRRSTSPSRPVAAASSRTRSSAPVAAIRSQTSTAASASSARRSSSARVSSASRAQISGRVTVPSSRSVPRALPVRSGGPATSSTSSSIWKARPISRPNAVSASSAAGSGRPTVQAHSNSRAVFSRHRAHVALRPRGRCRRRRGAGRARRAPAPPRRRPPAPPGARETVRAAPAAIASSSPDARRPGELGERPREQQVADRGRARLGPEVANTVGRPRRSGAASRTSSCTRVAMWTSSIAVAARIASSPGVRARAQQHQHRPQALATGLERRGRRRRRAPRRCRATSSASRASTWPIRRGSQASAASITTVTGGGTLARAVH